MQDLENYLKPTEHCDFNHPEIQKIAKEFKEKYPDQKELAVKLFYFVRDGILYRLALWHRKASETLVEKSGTCTNKANLLVALFRACGIPAGYGLMKVRGQEYFGGALIPVFKNRVAPQSVHFYCGAYLNGKWIKCDPSDDKELSENIYYFDPVARLVNWDGEHDDLLGIEKEHIISDEFPLQNIEEYFHKKPKNAKGPLLKIGNIYVNFLRENREKVSDMEHLQRLFLKWLKKEHFFYFIILFPVVWYRALKQKTLIWATE